MSYVIWPAMACGVPWDVSGAKAHCKQSKSGSNITMINKDISAFFVPFIALEANPFLFFKQQNPESILALAKLYLFSIGTNPRLAFFF